MIFADTPSAYRSVKSPFRLIAGLLLLILLSACATAPVEPQPHATGAEEVKSNLPTELAKQRKAALSGIDQWNIQGRIGVTQGDDGFSASIKWLQSGEEFDIQLFDPLGRRVAWLQGNNKQVTLVTAKGKQALTGDPQKLIYQQFGWTLPVSSLFYWVKGVPNPTSLTWYEEYDEHGRIVKLEQADWKVKFLKYQSDEQLAFPRLAKMDYEDFSLKLLVRQWK